MNHMTILRASLRIRALVKTFKRSGFLRFGKIALDTGLRRYDTILDSRLRGNDRERNGNDNAGKNDNARSDRRLDTGLRRYDRKKLGYDKERGKNDRGAQYKKIKTTLKKKLDSNTHTTINSMQFILTRQNSILKKRFAPVVVVMTLFSLIVGQSNLANAATHTFVQNDWSGGATANTASHLTATSGWTQYSTSTGIVPSGGSMLLDSSSRTVTQTTDADFGSGLHTNATTSGGSVSLSLASEDYTLTQTNDNSPYTDATTPRPAYQTGSFKNRGNVPFTATGMSNATTTGTATSASIVLTSGLNWATSTVDWGGNVGIDSSISAGDADTVFISYYDFTRKDLNLAKTTDGGATWATSTVDSSSTDTGKFSTIKAVGTSTVFISYYDSTNSDIEFAKSTNGGASWTSSNIYNFPGTYDTYGTRGISIDAIGTSTIFVSFFDRNNAYVVLAKSLDGGTNWTTYTAATSVGVGSQGLSLDAVSTSTVFITHHNSTGGAAKVLKTINGGTNWTSSVQYVSKFPSLSAVDANTIFVSYHNTTSYLIYILKSVDGGANFSTIATFPTITYDGEHSSIKALDANNVFLSYTNLSSLDLKYAKTVDGGTTWATSTLDSTGSVGLYNSIDVVDSNTIFVSYFDDTNDNLNLARTYIGYSPSGTYTSYFDASSTAVNWDQFSWASTSDGDGTISFKVKTAAATTSVPDFASGACTGSASPITLTSCSDSSHRFLWYEATFSNADDALDSPTLDSVTVTTKNRYNTPGTYESTAINTGQKTKDGSSSLSWSETLNGLAANSVQLQMSSSNETYSDNFDGTSLDTSKWSQYATAQPATQSAGGLITDTTAVAGKYSGAWLMDTIAGGDFDVQVDFSLLEGYPSGCAAGDYPQHAALNYFATSGGNIDWTNNLRLSRYCSAGAGEGYIATLYMLGTTTLSQSTLGHADANGKLRLTRQGNNFYAYYWNNSTNGWVLFASFLNKTAFPTTPGKINVWSVNSGIDVNLRTKFDNFIVWGDNNGDTSGAFFGSTGATSTYYTAEAGTMLHANHNGSQYFRYKATLDASSDTSVTPTLDAASLSYQYYGNKGPVGLWHFDGTAGSVASDILIADSSGFGNNGTSSNANGSGLAYADQTGNLDALGTAMNFDGVDDYISIPAPAGSSLDIDTNPVTLEAWVNPVSASSSLLRIVSRGQNGVQGYGILLNTSGGISLGGTGGSTFTSLSSLAMGQWNHVVGIIDGSSSKIYINGTLDQTGTVNVVSSDMVTVIGAGWSGSVYTQFFDGQIDEVAIYDRALSAAEIAAHYNSGAPATAITSGVQDSILISSPYNTTDAANALASIQWTASSLPANTSIKFQLRTAADNAGAPGTWTAWAGPDGSAGTYFTASDGSDSLSSAIYNTNAQWFQYKAIASSNGNDTPAFTSVTTTYVVNAPPTATISSAEQIATTSDADWGKVRINFSLQDTDTVTSFATTTFAYNNGGTWTAIPADQIRIADALDATVTSPLAVSSSVATAYTAYWTAVGNISTSTNAFSVRISANDGQPANATGTATTANFSVDTITPTVNYLTFDAGTADLADSASITVSAPSDFSAVYYQLSDGTTTSTWTAISATTTATWTFSSPIEAKSINLQLRDAYGNYGATSTYTGPAAIDPALFFIQDVTKLAIGDYRLYVGWATSSAVNFASYKVEYATSSDNSTFGSYTLAQNITDNATAYFVHSGLNLNLYYKYRISIVDTSGNVSLRSGFVTARPDGVQNFGEGGGGSVATASYITNVVPTQNTANGTVSATYTLTDSSITSKTSPSYEGYLLYNIGVTLATSTADSITLSDATKLPATGFIQVNHEIIGYASKSGNVLNSLTRGTWPTAATTRTSRQNTTFFVGTPVWIVASSTTPVSISNSTISSGQSGTITWNTLAETTLAGSSYSNIGIRTLVHDNQPASSGPLSSQNDQTDDGVLSTLDLTAPTVQFATSSASVLETASASTTLTATLSKPYALAVSANYTTGGTAVLNTDYLMASTTATLTFASRTTTSTLSVQPLNNLLYGSDKTVTVTLSSPSNATLGSNSAFTLTIVEADVQPTIAFVSATGTGAETTATVSIPVTLSIVSSATTTASYAVSASSTAVSGDNYTLDAGTVSFAAGTTTASIPLTIIHDGIYSSPDRTVIVTLSSPSGAALGTTTSFTYTIEDADLIPQVNFALATSTIAETGATTTINITLSYASNQEISIPVTVDPSSTAVSNTNYTIATSTITVPAGSATSSIDVVVLHDTAYGAAKTLILSLGSADGMTLGASTTHTLTITEVDNAAPEVSSVTASQVASSSDANFGKVSIAYSVRDANTTSGIVNSNYITPTFEYNSGLGWNTITSLRAEDTTDKTVTEIGFSPYTAVWDVSTQLGSVSLSDVQIRVNANDNESLNGIGRGTSTLFTIDTQAPQATTFRYDGRTGLLSMVITDTNTITYTLSNNADMSADGVNAQSGIATATGTSEILSTAWTVATVSPTIYLSVTDSFGNTASTSRAIPEPATGIAFYDTSDTAAGIYKEFITWNVYSSTTTTFASYTLYRSTDGGSTFTSSSTIADAATNYYLDTDLSTSTTYAYKLTVTDTAGTISTYSDTVTDQPDGRGSTDLAAPVITSAQAVSVQNVSATITWTTDEASDSTVDWGTTTAYGSTATSSTLLQSHSVTLTGLTPNTAYVFRVKSKDASNNEATEDNSGTGYAFTTGGGPVITGITSSATDRAATITWTTNKTGTASVRYSKNSSFNGYNDISGTVTPVGDASTTDVFTNTVSITGLESGGYYWYRVQSTDTSSNTTIDDNGGSYYTFQTLSDIYAPTISNLSTPVTTSASVVVFWKTDELATSQVQYDLTSTSTFANSSTLDTTYSIYHSIVVAGLPADTTYNYRVRSTDAFGNEAVSTTTTFATAEEGEVTIVTVGGGGAGIGQFTEAPEVKDTTAPVISSTSIATTTPFGATIAIATNEPTSVFVEYGKDTNYGGVSGNYQLTQSHVVDISGLRFGTSYHFRVRVTDKSGNVTVSEDKSFDTKFIAQASPELRTIEDVRQYEEEIEATIASILPGILPPFIEQPAVTDITENSATVTWRTNVRTYSSVLYSTEEEYVKTPEKPYTAEVADNSSKVADHSILLIGLKPNTKYHLMARSFSLPQAVGSSNDLTFTTKAPAVQASIIDVKTTSFRAAWTTDVPASSIVEYKNLKTGVIERIIQEPLVSYHDILVDNLRPGTRYEVKVLGYSEQGNLLSSGVPMNVLTSTDISAPKISNFKVDGALVPGRTDRIQTIVSWTTDEPSTGIVEYQEGAGSVSGGFANKVTVTDSYVTNHVVILTSLKPGTIYQFKITSADQAGNTASFGPRTIITPQKGESIFDVIFKNFEDTFKFLRGAGQ